MIIHACMRTYLHTVVCQLNLSIPYEVDLVSGESFTKNNKVQDDLNSHKNAHVKTDLHFLHKGIQLF